MRSFHIDDNWLFAFVISLPLGELMVEVLLVQVVVCSRRPTIALQSRSICPGAPESLLGVDFPSSFPRWTTSKKSVRLNSDLTRLSSDFSNSYLLVPGPVKLLLPVVLTTCRARQEEEKEEEGPNWKPTIRIQHRAPRPISPIRDANTLKSVLANIWFKPTQ